MECKANDFVSDSSSARELPQLNKNPASSHQDYNLSPFSRPQHLHCPLDPITTMNSRTEASLKPTLADRNWALTTCQALPSSSKDQSLEPSPRPQHQGPPGHVHYKCGVRVWSPCSSDCACPHCIHCPGPAVLLNPAPHFLSTLPEGRCFLLLVHPPSIII